MRFLKLFLSLLLVAAVITGVVGAGLTEGRVWWEARNFKSEFLAVRRLVNQDSKAYEAKCLQKVIKSPLLPIPNEGEFGGTLVGFQLRFVDSTNWVIEAVCNGFSEPLLVSQGQLAYGVKRLAGSGILWPIPVKIGESPPPPEALVLVGNRWASYAVGVKEGDLISERTSKDRFAGPGADAVATICSGWGGDCCDPITQVGKGEAQDKVTDCVGACYPVCLNRPQLVFFNTDPILDAQTREVWIDGVQVEVRFGYEVTDVDGPISQLVIDFGNGVQVPLPNTQGVTAQEYRCDQPECVYQARLTVVDSDGLLLPETRLATIVIRQRGK